ncbi:MAG: LD-carboxypeptidase [Duncaniella sp.]|nr:LD-carboxypeptidase [Duncaniella sp.]
MNLPAIIPPPLRKGSRIAIVSPSGAVDADVADGAAEVFSSWGFVPEIMPHALCRHGSFAGTMEERLADITHALISPRYDAVMCSRGGFGAVHLLDPLSRLPLRDNPKWLIGYSDITALHCLMSSGGIASLHAPNCRHLAENRGRDDCSLRLLDILSGKEPRPVVAPTHSLAIAGKATGVLRGGNFAVLSSLISTPFDTITRSDDTILFLEDISEPIYKVERMLHTLRLNGTLSRLRGIIFGQFTNYRPTDLYETMEQMIAPLVADLGIPVAFNFPTGHVDLNYPLMVSAPATLTVGEHTTELINPV